MLARGDGLRVGRPHHSPPTQMAAAQSTSRRSSGDLRFPFLRPQEHKQAKRRQTRRQKHEDSRKWPPLPKMPRKRQNNRDTPDNHQTKVRGTKREGIKIFRQHKKGHDNHKQDREIKSARCSPDNRDRDQTDRQGMKDASQPGHLKQTTILETFGIASKVDILAPSLHRRSTNPARTFSSIGFSPGQSTRKFS
jgi:hypothetical protein